MGADRPATASRICALLNQSSSICRSLSGNLEPSAEFVVSSSGFAERVSGPLGFWSRKLPSATGTSDWSLSKPPGDQLVCLDRILCRKYRGRAGSGLCCNATSAAAVVSMPPAGASFLLPDQCPRGPVTPQKQLQRATTPGHRGTERRTSRIAAVRGQSIADRGQCAGHSRRQGGEGQRRQRRGRPLVRANRVSSMRRP